MVSMLAGLIVSGFALTLTLFLVMQRTTLSVRYAFWYVPIWVHLHSDWVLDDYRRKKIAPYLHRVAAYRRAYSLVHG